MAEPYNQIARILAGLEIFKRNGGCDVCAEHDVIYSGQGEGVALSADDLKALDAAGWSIDCTLCDGCGPSSIMSYSSLKPALPDGAKHAPTCNQWSHFV